MLTHLTQLSGVSSGWLTIAITGVAVLSYFCGCFNGAVIVSRYILKNDIRNHGSGNAGLTNFHRTFGGPLTGLVLLTDAAKMAAAVLFARWIFGLMGSELVTFSEYWAGLFCLLGHMFPCMFQFKGGKGILSGGVLALMIDWRVALVVWGGFLLLALLTRYVSLGSCWAGASFPVVSALVFRDSILTVLALIAGLLVLWQHRANIKRLITRSESKFSLHKNKAPAPAEPAEPSVSPVEQPASPEEASHGSEPAHTAAPENETVRANSVAEGGEEAGEDLQRAAEAEIPAETAAEAADMAPAEAGAVSEKRDGDQGGHGARPHPGSKSRSKSKPKSKPKSSGKGSSRKKK